MGSIIKCPAGFLLPHIFETLLNISLYLSENSGIQFKTFSIVLKMSSMTPSLVPREGMWQLLYSNPLMASRNSF